VLAEVAQTVDDVVIIAAGRLVSQSSLADLASRSRPGVRVRTPQVTALQAALTARGIRARLVADDALVAFDTTTETLGRAVAGIGAVIYEMTPEHFNLEDIYLELTATEVALR
jgi:ABC-2 type transport system ATP-binding protein